MSSAEVAQLMDGTALSRRILKQTEERVYHFGIRFGLPPCLAAVLVGGDPASMRYAKLRQVSCQSAGIDWRLALISAKAFELLLLKPVVEHNNLQRLCH